jgi:hypothetical protein
MKFLYLYPTYEKAREAWEAKSKEIGTGAFSSVNLSIRTGSAYHKFNYVPVKVHIDLERLGFQTGIVYTEPLIDALLEYVKFELTQLAQYALGAGRLEYDGSLKPVAVQTPNVAASGGTGEASSLKLGGEIISGPPILQSGSDV